MAELIVKVMPIEEQEKKAYIYYREGLSAQDRGDYSEALECYETALEHKPDPTEHGGDEWEKLKKDTQKAIERINKIIGD